MRQYPGESYADWAERVRAYELQEALKEIRKGADVNLVMEAMSTRVMKKLLHPLMISIRESVKTDYNSEEGKAQYFKALNRTTPIADHVFDEDNLPKNIDDAW